MDKNNKLFIKKLIAKKIKNARLEKKLSQEDLARLSGLSVNCISNLENAKQNSRIKSIDLIASALNIPLIDFFKE